MTALQLRLERVVGQLPEGFGGLLGEAKTEGFRSMDRLAADWATGATRFDGPGEILLAAYADDRLVGIGGLTIDPVAKDALRMRRFYVCASFRRIGVGSALARALLARAAPRTVTVNAAAGSFPFWEALGFVADPQKAHTHIRSA